MSEDIQPTLDVPRGEDLAAYRQSILQRFENPAMRHQLAQIAWDGSQKLPIRTPRHGRRCDSRPAGRSRGSRCRSPPGCTSSAQRAAIAMPIVDPLGEQLAACGRAATGDSRHDLPLFLDFARRVFLPAWRSMPAFVQALGGAYDLIARRGPLAAVAVPETQ